MGKKKTANKSSPEDVAGSTAALQEEGNKLVALGNYQEALQKYAAALAAASSDDSDAVRKAALRSNRSLCCLKLGQFELAHAEALKCKELAPQWPKAHYRAAAASEAMGKLGDARLALCEGKRYAPTDKEILSALEALRLKIFPGATLALGEALDSLEEFTRSPDEVLAAVTRIKDLLQQGDGEQSQEDRSSYLRTFIDGCGPATVFRRQNAMGDNWKEECQNGTMSILSQIVQLTPKLEAELVVLNKQAESKDQGHDGSAACDDTHGGLASSKVPAPAAPRRQAAGVKKKKPQVRKLGAACDFGELEGEEEEAEEKKEEAPKARPQKVAEAPKEAEKKEQAPKVPEETPGAKRAEEKEGEEGRRAKMRAEVETKVRQAREAQRWAALCTPGEGEEEQAPEPEVDWVDKLEMPVQAPEPDDDSQDPPAWLEQHWPKLASTLPRAACTQLLVEHLRRPQPAQLPAADRLLAQWLFVVQIRREQKVLWSTSLGAGHAVKDWDVPQALPLPQASPSRGNAVYDRADVAESGDKRRLGVAGTVAALDAASKAGLLPGSGTGPAADFSAVVAAVHLRTGRVATLPATLVLGSRCERAQAPGAQAGPLCVNVGLGAQDAGGTVIPQDAPGPKKKYLAGSVEVRVGIGFTGPGGAQVAGPGAAAGGAMLLAACLEASAAWAADSCEA